jgi:hypothetical protein
MNSQTLEARNSSTTLNSPAVRRQFATAFVKLQTIWQYLNIQGRQDAMQSMINDALLAAGIPASALPQIRFGAMGTMLGGYNPSTNIITLNNLFLSEPIPDQVAKLLCLTIYHEIQHALQAKQVADLLANQKVNGRYLTAAEIVARTKASVATNDGRVIYSDGLSLEMAQAAVNDRIAGKKLTAKETQEANALLNSLFTPAGMLARDQRVQKYNRTVAAQEAATVRYEEAIRRNASPQEIKDLQEKLRIAKSEASKAFNEYASSTEEKPAYFVQNGIKPVYEQILTRQRNSRSSAAENPSQRSMAHSSNNSGTPTVDDISENIALAFRIFSETIAENAPPVKNEESQPVEVAVMPNIDRGIGK